MPAPERPNPYAPKPATPSSRGARRKSNPLGHRAPATRSARVLAHIIDVILFLPIAIAGVLLMLYAGTTGFWIGLGILVFGALILIVLQIVFWVRGSATIGMRAMKI